MITGTAEQWADQFTKHCVCGHAYKEHINGKGPCGACLNCPQFLEEKP